MFQPVVDLLVFVARIAWLIAHQLIWPAIAFAVLALAVKGRDAIEAARRAGPQTRVTLGLYVLDLFLFGPPLGMLVMAIAATLHRFGLELFPATVWSGFGTAPTLVLTLFAGDFASYWRHRLEHSRWLWPAHAIHHSDDEVTWLTGNRFHPVNNLTTAVIDNTVLALLGFPPWAIAANAVVRHYYGEFIHADVPWTYGPLGRVFVSPAMHRWHHARDVAGSGSNFATLFSVFDQAFGTHYVPGPCTVALGVNDTVGRSTTRQLLYPFRQWIRRVVRWRRRQIPTDAPGSAVERAEVIGS